MGRIGDMYGGKEKFVYSITWEIWKEESTWKT
jgi:hypothetical protein